MSDLYDSLDDVSYDDDDDDDSCHSLDKLKTNFVNRVNEGTADCESISDGHEPFYLDQKEKSEGREIEVPQVQVPTINDSVSKKGQTNGILPKVHGVKKIGSNSASYNLAIDNEDLVKKGLQLNKDGSFTKSPRFETEQLPFVNPDYKNVQFQKSKAGLRGKSHFSKKNRKNQFTFKENSKDEISMTGIIKSREAKGSSEEILTSDGSLPSFKGTALKSGENFDRDNLTDSMKEMIMQKQHESLTARANRSSEQYKKPGPDLSLPRDSKNPKSKTCSNNRETLPHVSDDRQNDRETNSVKRKSQPNTWKKKLPEVDGDAVKDLSPFVKKRSEVILNFTKPRLSYLERHQRESGFNPLYLRYGVKRTPSDTNRSIFGDSVADKLSESSSRVVSSRAIIDDEDEELFYRRLIEKEKSKQWEMNRTSRSDVHNEEEKCVLLCSSNSCKNQRELKGSHKLISKPKLKKSTSIDMPPSTKANSPMNPSKKYSHYCSINVSSSLSKTELAQKAKAYGYLANARNIFKMKNGKMDGKTIQSESEISGKRNCKKVMNNETTGTRPNEISEEIERGLVATSKRLLRTSKSLCKTEKCGSVAHRELVLPPVLRVSDTTDLEPKADVLNRIRYCLDGAANEGAYFGEPYNVYGTMKTSPGKYANYAISLPPFKCVP